MSIRRALQIFALAMVLASLQGCVGMALGAATDLTIATAKVPFKVGAAILDVASGDDHPEHCDHEHD